MTMKLPKYAQNEAGFALAVILAVTLFLSALAVSMATIAISNVRFTGHEQKSTTALNVAEAGINYYLWHLSHNTTDYCDGASTCTGAGPFGPYAHDYYDTSGNKIGTYTLTITPPANGSTVTTIQSVGQVPGLKGTRTILAQLGIPSFASYALLTGTEVWFGPGESSAGPVHSNVGVHMDGTNNGQVTSASATYKPTPQFGGDGATHNGVWGTGGPTSQWQFPVPPIDFTQVTANYNTCISSAQSNGVYLAKTNKRGYYLNLLANGTIDIYTVTNETSSGISKTFLRNQTAPTNGIFYVEDNVWVSGTNFPGKINILSGRLPDLPATNTTITIIDNLTYKAKDGSVVIGLIAQKDVVVATYAPSTIEIDAAILAQKGHVYYPNSGSLKSTLNFWGAIDSFDYWTWSWETNGTVTKGYPTNNTVFDTHLPYGPPPCYPTTGSFSILNWRELLYNP
jgi:hypothetical protein